jgi:hypothetical protein
MNEYFYPIGLLLDISWISRVSITKDYRVSISLRIMSMNRSVRMEIWDQIKVLVSNVDFEFLKSIFSAMRYPET